VNLSEKNIVIFASGNGTNAENIIKYFQDDPEIGVSLVISNRKKAFVHRRAKDLNVHSITIDRDFFYYTELLLKDLKRIETDLIVLAGFLWLFPEYLVKAFPNKIVNVHPALLPKYGGKGMYGKHVHKAVKDAGEKETGISIHYVNERYDEGQIIYQAKTSLTESDTVDDIADKVHKLEIEHFPRVIKELLSK